MAVLNKVVQRNYRRT